MSVIDVHIIWIWPRVGTRRLIMLRVLFRMVSLLMMFFGIIILVTLICCMGALIRFIVMRSGRLIIFVPATLRSLRDLAVVRVSASILWVIGIICGKIGRLVWSLRVVPDAGVRRRGLKTADEGIKGFC